VTHPRAGARRPALIGLVLAGTALSGCSLLGFGTSADDEADALAKALAAGKLSSIDFGRTDAKQAQALWDRTVEGLGSTHPSVRVDSVSKGKNGDATARLAYTWRLSGAAKPWTYLATAKMHQGDGGTNDGWTVSMSPTLVHSGLQDGDRLARATTFADRADILGAHGSTLVTERPVFRFGIDKTSIAESLVVPAARRLARRLGIDEASYTKKVKAAGPKAFVEALVLRPADARRYRHDGTDSLPGVGVVPDTLPLAPNREFARAVLGVVGPVDADIVKQSKGLYQAGDEAGLTGLENRYDERLRGTPGVKVVVIDAKGGTRDLFTVDPKPGKPLRTTLVPRLQTLAEKALSGTKPAAALVAIRPSTGDLLAVANGPGSRGQSTATVGQYAPGSTFKVVSSLALLRAGLKPSTVIPCPPTTDVNGKTFKNYSDYPPGGIGRIPLSTAVANSCNTAFVGQRDKVSQADLADAAASLGLGVDHDIGFPAYFGSVPKSDSTAGGETGHAASMIGQGRVVASPMAMAAVAASVKAGRTVVPRLLLDQKSDSSSATPLKPSEAAALRSLMRGVVQRGSGSVLASLPPPPVLAKTGTAEFGDQQRLQTHTWMIAVHGDLACAVFVDVGESGSRTAGPILLRFLAGAG
jgi:cell division protein FtsI/penicillin-binding protein 2